MHPLLHPPKQCHVGGSLHAQPERTSRDHCLSAPFCVLSVVLLMFLIATEEDYRRVVETFG